MLTVIAEPHMNVVKGPTCPGATRCGTKSRSYTPGPSPLSSKIGKSAIALNRFVYQLRLSALPFTTSRLRLMTTECMAVIIELVTPKKIPRLETLVPSRNTPTKKPIVTTEHAKSTSKDGRACRKKKDNN